METRKSHKPIEPDHDGEPEVGVIGGLARVVATGEPPEGLAKEEVLAVAGEKGQDEKSGPQPDVDHAL